MGKGPGVLNTVLKKKHHLFKALASMSEASGDSYAVVLIVTSRVYTTVCVAHIMSPTYCYTVMTQQNIPKKFGKIPKYQF